MTFLCFQEHRASIRFLREEVSRLGLELADITEATHPYGAPKH